MASSRYPIVVLLCAGLLLTGCSRSPKEQLAYQHAEEQYQINQRNAEHMRERASPPGQEPSQAADESAPMAPLRQ